MGRTLAAGRGRRGGAVMALFDFIKPAAKRAIGLKFDEISLNVSIYGTYRLILKQEHYI